MPDLAERVRDADESSSDAAGNTLATDLAFFAMLQQSSTQAGPEASTNAPADAASQPISIPGNYSFGSSLPAQAPSAQPMLASYPSTSSAGAPVSPRLQMTPSTGPMLQALPSMQQRQQQMGANPGSLPQQLTPEQLQVLQQAYFITQQQAMASGTPPSDTASLSPTGRVLSQQPSLLSYQSSFASQAPLSAAQNRMQQEQQQAYQQLLEQQVPMAAAAAAVLQGSGPAAMAGQGQQPGSARAAYPALAAMAPHLYNISTGGATVGRKGELRVRVAAAGPNPFMLGLRWMLQLSLITQWSRHQPQQCNGQPVGTLDPLQAPSGLSMSDAMISPQQI